MGEHRRGRQPHELRAAIGGREASGNLGRESGIADRRSDRHHFRIDTRNDCESGERIANGRTGAWLAGISAAIAMISRRVFLKSGGFALVSLGFAPSFLARTAFAAGRSGRAKQLIAIFQRGAVDGLSVIVPFGEADYYRSRPSIAIPRPNAGDNAAVDLNGFFGFNPRLLP